jgi:hypothetical protein
MSMSILTRPCQTSTRVLIDSARFVNHNPAFGIISDPIDWDAMAEDIAHLDAACRGFLPL